MTQVRTTILKLVKTYNQLTLTEIAAALEDNDHISEVYIHSQVERMINEGAPIKVRNGVVSLTWKYRFKRWIA
jgi:chromosomal replication initiation ATPase DnaA